jgi:hypothetical protein
LPGRFRRGGKQQRVPAFWLKFQLQLHAVTLAERLDNGCPRVKEMSFRCAPSYRVLPSPLRA